MNNKEAVIATLQITGYPDNAIEKALFDNVLDGEDSYSINNKELVDSISINVLQGMLSVASISEGGYSVSYSIEGVKLRLAQLGAGPTVKAVNFW